MADTDDLYGYGALNAGIKGFAQGMADAEDRKFKRLEMEAKLESAKFEKERHRFLDGLTARDKGFQVEKGQDLYKTDPSELKYDQTYLDLQQQKANSDPFGLKGVQFQNAVLEGQKKKQDIVQGNQEAQRKTLSPIQGFYKGDQYVGTPDEEKHLRAAQADVQKFNTTMQGLRAKVAAAKTEDLANPISDTAKGIKNDLRDLQLIYKGPAFAQLGVLTGPDLKLLEEIVENPGTLSNLVSGKDGVLKRYDQAAQRVNDNFSNKAVSLGLVAAQPGAVAPKTPQSPGKLTGGKLTTGRLEAPKVPAAKPKTVIQNGVTYTLNPKTGEYE